MVSKKNNTSIQVFNKCCLNFLFIIDASIDDLQLAYCGPCKDGGLELPTSDKDQDKLSSESLDMFEKCNCKITREWNPVCGTNNVTYSNPSIFYCSNKCIDPSE